MWKRWGTPQNFFLAFIDELSKTQRSEFWKNEKKLAAGTILNMCTKNHNRMRYSSWDMEWDKIFCDFESFFTLLPPPPPNNSENQNFKKNKKSIWGCHHFKFDQLKTQSHYVCLLRYGVSQTQFFVIIGHFLLFYPTIESINQNFQKMKKKHTHTHTQTWRYHHFTHVYHKWQSYDIWFLRYKVQLFCHLGPFFALFPCSQPEIWKYQKNEKNAWRYHHFTQVYQVAILFLRYGMWRM